MDYSKLTGKMKQINLMRRILIQKALPDIELYFGQLPILEYIREHDGCTQIEVAEKLCVTPASISTSTKRLQKAGLLTKKTDPGNLRCNRLSITEEGIRRCEVNRSTFDKIYDMMFLGLEEDDLETLNSTLDKILVNLMSSRDIGELESVEIGSLIQELRKNEDRLKKQFNGSGA